MKLTELIKSTGASAPNINPALLERDVDSFVIDSREIGAGDVFFALSQPDYQRNGFNGDFDDATKFASSALQKGAVACVLRRDRFEEHRAELSEMENRLIFVDDAIKALQDLAMRVYSDWNKPVIAITGSAGKTTGKELTAHVLAASGRKVLRNTKNYNNGIGHPLTVLELARDNSYDIAVLEMGMSTPMHEIERLCRITPPDVAVVLNVLPVHVEHLGSIDNVAKAKAEIIEGMKEGGTAVLNADDSRVLEMRGLSKGDVITFGIEAAAGVTASDIRFEAFGRTSFRLKTPQGEADISYALNGRHNVLNALAAAAAAHATGMAAGEIAAALETAAAPGQRGEILRFADGFTVINDSYNSNPTALLSMVETMVGGAAKTGRKIVVAGEMLELGEDARRIHRETGQAIAEAGVDLLIGVRGLAADLVDGAKAAGLENVIFANDSDEGGKILQNEIKPRDIVLIKGSRGVRTEKVLEKLIEKFELEKNTSGIAV